MTQELNMLPKYKVDYIHKKLTKNKWGNVDIFETSKQCEAMLNEYHAKGYKLLKILEDMKDDMGFRVPLFIFELEYE